MVKEQIDEIEKITQEIKKAKILSEVLKPEVFAPPNGWAEKIVLNLKGKKGGTKLKTSQLRKIFSEIKSICQKKIKGISEDNTDLYLLYPKLAYAQGRDLMPKNFYELLVTCLDKLKNSSNKKDFEMFEKFITAIVAYNKKYE